jgi:hypothetical protein
MRVVALLAALFLASSNAIAAPGAMGGSLSQMVNRWERGDPNLSLILSLHLNSRGDPLVVVRADDGVSAEQLLRELSTAGFRLTALSSLDARLAEGYLPLGSARAATAIPGVRVVKSVLRPQANVGLVTSQAVALQKADRAQALGFDGRGVRVGALSDSFDNCASCGTHAADDVASGDLPAGGVTVLQEIEGPPDSGIDEGRAMLQLIHDIAPGSQLGFASAFNGEVQFAENILALRSQFHADVIVDDVIYFDEPMFSDGIVAQAADAVHADGGTYFSSAMNNGIEAYESDYRPVSFARAQALVAAGRENVKLEQIPPPLRPRSFHDFGGLSGTNITQLITTAGDNIIDFQWDEPFFLGKVRTDYNIYIFDAAGNFMDPDNSATVFYTHEDNVAADEAIELAEILPFPGEIHGGANASDYQFLIGKMNDGPARHIKHVVINGLAPMEQEGASSTWGHAAARGAQGVAATFYALPDFPEDFSSPGPTTIFFDVNGDRLHKPEVRFTPQITAADGVNNTFFPPFPGADTEGDGFPNFFGTSAAAPDAAAVAAQVIQAAGGPGRIKPDKLYRTLQRTATPIPLPDDRTWALAFSGPVAFNANGDWTRWNRYFGLTVLPLTSRSVRSVAFNTVNTETQLVWSLNPNRFHVGPATGVAQTDMTFTVSADQKTFTINFAPGSFGAGDSFRFGMSVFNALQGSTQEDPDRFRGMTVTTTLDDGRTFTGTVFAAPKQPINRFTGYGLVNAEAAVKSVRGGHGDNDD